MVKSLLALIFAALSAVGIHTPPLSQIAPCVAPISYRVEGFDRRFGVSYTKFLTALTEAETIWEAPLGRNLFDYRPEDGKLAVNLIYDYRQRATEALTSIQGTLNKGNAQYREFQTTYNSLKANYDALKVSYDAQAAAWEAHNTAYEADVEKWNAGPRTSKSEFQELETTRIALEAEAADLKNTETRLNTLARDTNALVGQLNTLAKDLNLGVKQYNEVGHERGETFTGGEYTSDGEGERVDIYEFENHTELVRVLAHELGHALGLEHVSDPDAIMYAVDNKVGSKATEADIVALKTLCGVQ